MDDKMLCTCLTVGRAKLRIVDYRPDSFLETYQFQNHKMLKQQLRDVDYKLSIP